MECRLGRMVGVKRLFQNVVWKKIMSRIVERKGISIYNELIIGSTFSILLKHRGSCFSSGVEKVLEGYQ